MSRWAALEPLRERGLEKAIPVIENQQHLLVMFRDEQKRKAVMGAWVGVRVARGERVIILVSNGGEGKRLGALVEGWLKGVGVWVGAGDSVWGRRWQDIQQQEVVVVLTYRQFLNQMDRWPRWGFYSIVLWGVDCWLRPRRNAILEALMDLLLRCRAQVSFCVVSPRLREGWVAWLKERVHYGEFGELGRDVLEVPCVHAIDMSDVADYGSPLDFVENNKNSCLVASSDIVEHIRKYGEKERHSAVVFKLSDACGEVFKRVYLYDPRLEFEDIMLRKWAKHVAESGTLFLLFHGFSISPTVPPEQVSKDVRERLNQRGGFICDSHTFDRGMKEFLIQFLRRVHFRCRLGEELARTYLGEQFGRSFVEHCLQELEHLLSSELGLVERPTYTISNKVNVHKIFGETAEESDPVALSVASVFVRSGWLRLTNLGRETATMFHQLDFVAAVRTESFGWKNPLDLIKAMSTKAGDSTLQKAMEKILEGGKPPPDFWKSFDKKIVFQWRLQIAAFHTLHPKDKGLSQLKQSFHLSNCSKTEWKYRGFEVMKVLVPYIHDLFIHISTPTEKKGGVVVAPSRYRYLHYRDLAHWLGASPDTVYRLLRRFFPNPEERDYEYLRDYFAKRRNESLGSLLCNQVEELTRVVDHAYLRPTGGGRPRRVLVRLVEVSRGHFDFPPGFSVGCKDCVAYALHRRVCALAWHIVQAIGPSAVPFDLQGRDVHCTPRASPCDCFAPRRILIPNRLLKRMSVTPDEVLSGLRVYHCPILQCPGRVPINPFAHSGQCEVCGCCVDFDEEIGQVRVSSNRRGFFPALIDALTGVRVELPSPFQRGKSKAQRPLLLEPVAEIFGLDGECICWKTRVSHSKIVEGRRRLTSTDLILATTEIIPSNVEGDLVSNSIRILTYPTIIGMKLAPDSSVVADLRWGRTNQELLTTFGTSVILSALVATAELADFSVFDSSQVEVCLQKQIDLLIDFLRRGHFNSLHWMGLEGRIARNQADLVRRRLSEVAGKELVAVRGRYLARKVPVEEGRIRAAQSPYDEALNEAHRQMGWILRAENAAAGLGYFTPGHLFFHQRISGKNVHLDLDDVARRILDNQVLALFLESELIQNDFSEVSDSFGMPAYKTTANCVEKIHSTVDMVLQKLLRYDGREMSLLTAHRKSLGSLLDSLHSHNPSNFKPIIYLPVDTLSNLSSKLVPLKTLTRHLRSRIQLGNQSTTQSKIIEQILKMCEMIQS